MIEINLWSVIVKRPQAGLLKLRVRYQNGGTHDGLQADCTHGSRCSWAPGLSRGNTRSEPPKEPGLFYGRRVLDWRIRAKDVHATYAANSAWRRKGTAFLSTDPPVLTFFALPRDWFCLRMILELMTPMSCWLFFIFINRLLFLNFIKFFNYLFYQKMTSFASYGIMSKFFRPKRWFS